MSTAVWAGDGNLCAAGPAPAVNATPLAEDVSSVRPKPGRGQHTAPFGDTVSEEQDFTVS